MILVPQQQFQLSPHLIMGDAYQPVNSMEVQEGLYQALSIPQADLDWLNGQGSSTCPVGITFTAVDHPDPLTSQGGDNIATITISNTADWSHWNDNIDWGENWYVNAYCLDSNGDTHSLKLVQHSMEQMRTLRKMVIQSL